MRSTTFVTILSFIPILLASSSAPSELRTITTAVTRTKNPLVDEQGVVNADAFVNHAQLVSKRYSHRPLSKREQTVTAEVVNMGGAHWQTSISVGTPPRTFSVALDTGSSDMYLLHSNCSTRSCRGHNRRYDNAASTTSVSLDRNFTLQYADGSVAQGALYKDAVTFGGAAVSDQTFGAATMYHTNVDFPSDGLLGLSLGSASGFEANPLLESLVQGGQIDKLMFGAKFSTQESEITLGGVNPKVYRGDIFRNNVTSSKSWTIQLDSFNVNGKPIGKSLPVIIDSGSSLIMGDTVSVADFYQNIPGSVMEPYYQGIRQGIYSVPCDQPPTFSLTFGGKEFPFPADAFFTGRNAVGEGRCIGGVTSAFPVVDGAWVIGSNFLGTVYSVFDMSTNTMTVGFAELA